MARASASAKQGKSAAAKKLTQSVLKGGPRQGAGPAGGPFHGEPEGEDSEPESQVDEEDQQEPQPGEDEDDYLNVDLLNADEVRPQQGRS